MDVFDIIKLFTTRILCKMIKIENLIKYEVKLYLVGRLLMYTKRFVNRSFSQIPVFLRVVLL